MNNNKKIVIIGAGYGGIRATKILNKKLKKRNDIEIYLIDKNPYHTLMTELHEVAGGKLEPEALKVYLKKIFAGRKVNIIIDNVNNIDFKNRVIELRSNKITYDYLIIGTGSDPTFFGIKGAKENTLTLWSLDDAIKIKNHIENMFLLASRESDEKKRKEYLTFIVIGAGLTGVELIGEILNWKKVLCEKYYIDEDEVSLIIIEAKENVLPTMPASLQKKAKKYLEKKGVKVLVNHPVTEIEKNKVIVNNTDSFIGNTIIWTCGIEGGELAKKLNISKEQKNFRLKINEYIQSIDYPEVYIIGDLAWYKDKESAHPQIVETALQTGECAAKNIIREIENKEKEVFHPKYHGQMVSIGSYYGVANIMNFKLTGFFSLIMKHLVNIHYLFELAGVNQVWEYLKHHFLDIKDNRSLIGGHAAIKTRFYWVILLRILLAIMWLYEGTTKVLNGWLDPNNIKIVKIEKTDDTTEATQEYNQSSTDSTTQASSEWTTEEGKQQAWYPKPLIKPLPIYLWFEETVIKKFPFVFQAFVVITEILIGLALLGGLFTFIAAAGSIGLAIMFIISGMATKEILWYIFSAIVVMGGAGKSFGLDYWVIPFIKRIWNSQKIAWKTYLYIDNPIFKKKEK